MKTDYKCPHCHRCRKSENDSGKIVRWCSTCHRDVELVRIPWNTADWSLLNQPLADVMGLPVSVVAAKRRALGKRRGTVGRKRRTAIWRRIDPASICEGESNMANALRLGCTAERIRQLRAQGNAKDQPTNPAE